MASVGTNVKETNILEKVDNGISNKTGSQPLMISQTAETSPLGTQNVVNTEAVLCPICLQALTDPRILTCLHTCCEKCLKSEIQLQNQQYKLNRTFECPICNTNIRSPAPNIQPSEWAARFPANNTLYSNNNVQCSPCEQQGNVSTATGFCTDCGQFVCTKCSDDHKRFTVMRDHIIIVGETVLKNATYVPIYLKAGECENHAGKQCDLFCKDHDVLGCGLCRAAHNRCKGLVSLKEVSTGLKASPVLQETADKFDSFQTKFDNIKTQVEDNIKAIDSQKDEILKAITEFRVKLNTELDKLEKAVIEKMETTHTSVKEEMTNFIEECAKSKAAVETSHRMFSGFIETADESQLFISMRKITQQIKHYESRLKVVVAKTHLVKYEFKSDEAVDMAIRAASALGDVKILGLPLLSIQSSNDFVPKKANYYTEFKAKIHGDKHKCKITGTSFLPDGRLVLVDYGNQSIKLYSYDASTKRSSHTDRSESKLKESLFKNETSLHLHAGPKDVAVMDPSTIVLTIPETKEIMFVTVGATLGVREIVKTEGNYHGIICTNEMLITTCLSQKKSAVHVLNHLGEIVDRWYPKSANGHSHQRHPHTHFMGTPAKPYYLKLGPDGQKIYISDLNNGIICMDMSGNTIFTCTSKKFYIIEGITVHPQGNVFVADYKQQVIHQMAPDGSALGTLIGKDKQLQKPVSICYNGATNILLVSEQERDIIKCFKVI
ncbi:hypothetical protein ACJMK2_016172 [Sinanodonta woodiana]|uniref:Uncharacterized protein n=1 Tax=Sinanodonta woodiana TaxID=1069815 RepID=A0ABD3UVK4_SINWO